MNSLCEMVVMIDGPLFGINKGEKLLINKSLKPQNGNLVFFSTNDSCEIYRFETARGEPTLWPGNIKIKESEVNSLSVIINSIP
jgi:SOS-response transcriptional repressor LexA